MPTPCLRSTEDTLSNFSADRATSASFAPRWAAATAVAAPIPLDAPVMSSNLSASIACTPGFGLIFFASSVVDMLCFEDLTMFEITATFFAQRACVVLCSRLRPQLGLDVTVVVDQDALTTKETSHRPLVGPPNAMALSGRRQVSFSDSVSCTVLEFATRGEIRKPCGRRFDKESGLLRPPLDGVPVRGRPGRLLAKCRAAAFSAQYGSRSSSRPTNTRSASPPVTISSA